MPVFVKLRSLLRNLFSTRRVEVDLDKEVHSHLELLIAENIRAGMPPTEAQRAARIELGGIEQVKEQVREERMGNWLHSVISDCRYGIRQLHKNPGFTVVATLTLALGVGANTTIFSVVNALVLRPLPVPDPQQIVDAKSLLAISRSNGGISAMRQLIRVTERERGLLNLWAREEPSIATRIAQAVAFREAVLLEFDRLANGGNPTKP